ncbi:hypothetical protein SAMN02745136_00931 [Anaerocolumna jejuensis DSM 15929]|uniref:Uncharacterized protein n=1 Tax=Anaerocolumna jejuensis DSM 15929 TaxID=1121322 RepID=A0A1M6MBB6_9FIRM|nr:hypothetical protein [Anaerocolumna jejuensis]SHJ80660.1 hypothetical protein SAMN02745136_00931 [Anaerocolumna jejuensis DSM 15929]
MIITKSKCRQLGDAFEVPKLMAFRYKWCDAWYTEGWGYDAMFTTGEKGTWIDVLIDGNFERLNITDKEDEFIDDLRF